MFNYLLFVISLLVFIVYVVILRTVFKSFAVKAVSKRNTVKELSQYCIYYSGLMALGIVLCFSNLFIDLLTQKTYIVGSYKKVWDYAVFILSALQVIVPFIGRMFSRKRGRA